MKRVWCTKLKSYFGMFIALAMIISVSGFGQLVPKAYAAYPTTPPAQICGNSSVLSGPTTAPSGAINVPAGDNSGVNFQTAGATYYFAAGVHTLGNGAFSQIVPGNNSRFVGAPGAIIDGQKVNQYAFGQHATGVIIEYLTIRNFGTVGSNNNEGVVNHDAGDNWTIRHNTISGNAGAGVFVGTGNSLSYNCLTQNEQYGFSAYEAPSAGDPTGSPTGITLDHNEISYNNTYDWESHISGCGCTGGGKFWRSKNVVITSNYIHHNYSIGLWADNNNRGFQIEGNYISDNDNSGIMYETSYNALIKDNAIIGNAKVQGPSNPGFPTGAIYISESGSDSRVATAYSTTFDITGNLIKDNWGGVAIWENADRFCGSPANTSTGECTLVNPTVVTDSSCNASNINNAPYYNDCRWKTQNVHVFGNTFDQTPANVGAGCTFANSCSQQAVISNFGTYPNWSPYTGTTIQTAITYNQNNVWSNNTYTGTWQFLPFETGNTKTFAQWQASPYNQDAGSTLNSAQPPVNASITSFSASPATINSGSSSTLSWSVAAGSGCSINQTIGSVSNSGTRSVSPTSTTTYTLTCNGLNGGNSASAQTTVTVNSAPTPVNASITSFSASPATINSGSSSTLSWSVAAGTGCSINQGVGAVGTSGSQSVSPTATTTYTLTCNGLNGGTNASSQTTVTVNSAPTPVNASITSFSASSTTILVGQSSNLSWSVAAGTGCTINQGVGAVGTSGTQSVSPTATTTYTLTCNGLNGGTNASAQAAITVVASTDTDHDGIADQVEQSAPNNGDGNYDGIADVQQANVASILNAKTGAYNTLTSTNNCSFTSVSSNTTNQSGALLGAWSFRLGCASTTVTILLEKAYDNSTWKVAKQNSSLTSVKDITSRATVAGKVLGSTTVTSISYPVVDGGDLDEDATANGTIVDPVTVLSETQQNGTLVNTGQNVILYVLLGLGLVAGSALTFRYARK